MNQELPDAGRESQETIIGPPPNRAASDAVCSSCGQPLDSATRFCQACGAQVSPGSADDGRAGELGTRPRAWLALVAALWLVIMIAALYFIYARAFVVGST